MTARFLLCAGALCVGSLFATTPVRAQAYLTAGHTDIGIGYTPGDTEFEAHWHADSGAVVDGEELLAGREYAPGDLVAQPFTTTTSFGVPIANALGVASGSTVYRMGNNNYQPNLGFAAEEIGFDSLWGNDGYIKMTLTDFTGPGAMAISETANSGVIFSSLGGAFTDDDNQWEIFAGDHVHLHWFFSEAGRYDITFTWEGTYIGGETPVEVSGTGTFGVQVDAIPEPGTLALLLPGLAGLALYRRWRQRVVS